MSLICHLAEIIEQSRVEYEQGKAGMFRTIERLQGGGRQDAGDSGILVCADNVEFMQYLLTERHLQGKVQQIYIDPPFFSKANYDAVAEIPAVQAAKVGASESAATENTKRIRHRAYEDVWESSMERYLQMLCVRLLYMRDLLADDGTIWVHLDWHSVHYVKILLDEIFGDRNFINEIIWQYKSGGSSKRHFARKHDTILVYAKTPRYYLQLPKEKSYNRGLKPYRFKGVEEFCDEHGWYTMVNMKDVWTIDMVGRTSAERTGYATQKPEALLLRILQAGSRPGDLVCDFFSGSGTLGAAAAKCGRNWICCDSGFPALVHAIKRFQKEGFAAEVVADAKHWTSGLFAQENAKIKAEVRVEPVLHTDRVFVTVCLKDYRLKQMPETLPNKSRQATRQALKQDAFALLDYWCIDAHGNDAHEGGVQAVDTRKGCEFENDAQEKDDVFCAQRVEYRQKGKLALQMNWEADAAQILGKRIRVKTADVFGNLTFCEITVPDIW